MTKKPTPGGIRLLKTELVDNFYQALRVQQKEDQDFYDDIFKTNIKDPYHVVRTGSAARIVDTCVDHIVTAKIAITREPKKKSEKARESARKVAIFLTNLTERVKGQIEEAAKNAPLRGEAYWQVQFNPNDKEMPISITAPDPMIVNGDPNESLDGVPAKVIKYCKMTAGAVSALYPEWPNGGSKKTTDEVDYLAYFDDTWRYIEADEQSCYKAEVHPHLLGCIPFVHCASGFGKDSPEGKPEKKYVGRLFKARGRLIEECEIESRIDSIIGLWANPVINFEPTVPEGDAGPPPDEKSFSFAPGSVNVGTYGWKADIVQGAQPSAEMFAHQSKIQQALGLEVPPVAMGIPSTAGASGRQEDIYALHFRKKPERVEKNLERSLAVAFGQALRILDSVPKALPLDIITTEFVDGKDVRKVETLEKEDIGGYYDVGVEFKPDEEMEQARRLMMYRALYDSPSGPKVSWKTLLVKGLGMSEEEADEEIDESLVDTAMRTNPLLANIAVEEAMRELGLERQLAELKKAGEPLMTTGLSPMPGGQPRTFTGSPESRDTVRQMFAPEAGGEVRNPPPSTGGRQ